MTIDEAIEQEKFKARVDRIKSNKRIFHNNDEDKISACHRSAEEHEQLAEWLEDYKHIKQWKSDIMDSFCKYDVSSFEELIANARNKAIDDFANACKSNTLCQTFGLRQCDIDKIAEQLKAVE